jgi:biotin carboxylase
MSSSHKKLLVVHAMGAVAADRWLPILSELADVAVIYREDLLDSEDELDVLERCGKATSVLGGDDIVDAALRRLPTTPIHGILTFSEAMLGVTAALAEALQLPHHSTDAVRQMQRKDLQRVACEQRGIPGPRWIPIFGEQDTERAQRQLTFPVILKPAWGYGSSVTFRVEEPGDLPAKVAEATALYASDWRLHGNTRHLLVEEYLHGADWHGDARMGSLVSVESLIIHGEIHHLTVTDKFPPAEPFRETGDIMPSWLPASRRQEITGLAERCLRALGAYHGAAHTEIKMTPDGPRLIEVNGRLGGYMAGLMANVFRYDVVRAIGQNALGETPELPGPARGYVADVNLMSPAVDQVICDVRGIDTVRAMPGVEVAEANRLGSVPAWRLGGGCYGYIELSGATPRELLDLRDRVLETIRFETEPPRASAASG